MSPRPELIPVREIVRLGLLAGPRLVAAQFALTLLAGLLPLGGIVAMRLLVDAVAAGPAATLRPLGEAVAIASAIALLGVLVGALSGYVGDRHGRVVADRCAERLLERAAGLDLVQLEDPTVLDLLQRAGSELATRPARIVAELAALLLAAVTLLAMGTTLALLDPLLVAVVASAALPAVLLRVRHARRAYEWQKGSAGAQRELGYVSGVIASRAAAKELRAAGWAPRWLARARGLRDTLRGEQLALARARSRDELLGQALAVLALFFAYATLGARALEGAFGVGAFVMYAQAVQRTQNGVRDLVGSLAALGEQRQFLGAWHELTGLAGRIEGAAQAREGMPPRGAVIECRGLRYAYPGTGPVLDELDLVLQPGEHVALVGKNGCGKSTLVRLLARLDDPASGGIRVGGRDLRELALADWRAQLAVLFQDAVPLDATLRENLAPEAPPEAATAAPPAAAHDDAALHGALSLVGLGRLELAAMLGRRFANGVELSAGEWRRVLLARALVRPASCFVLDEPTAFLDHATVRELALRLRERLRGATLLIVEQRPEMLAFVDRICVMEGGRIVDEGSPAELAARDGPYRRLFGPPTRP